MIALRENIPYNIVLPSNAKRNWHDLLEIVAIEIQLNKNSKKALLCVCYRSQKYKTESWSQMFTEFLQDTQNYDLILITGDFNFPELTWNSTLVASRPVSAHSVEFRELTLDFFLEQTNTHSTRGDNILDLVFSRTPEAIKDLTCICPKTMNISSDHGLLMFDFHLTMSSSGCNKITVFDFKRADWNGLQNKLRFSNLSPTDHSNLDLDADWEKWKNTLVQPLTIFHVSHSIKTVLFPGSTVKLNTLLIRRIFAEKGQNSR